MVYQGNNSWDEDKWDIHSSGYHNKDSSGESGSGPGYKSEQEYGANKDEAYNSASDDYRKNEDENDDEEKEDEDEEPSIEDSLENEEEEKEKEKEKEKEMKDEDVIKMAAKQISEENQQEPKQINAPKKKERKSIDEAITKAIKEEKDTIIID